MAIPSSGAISFDTIQTEFGGSNPIGLDEYYAGGSYVASGISGTNGAVPSSGAISMNQFFGTTAPPAVGQQVFTGDSGSYTWVAPARVTKVSIVAVGRGGVGSGGAGGGLGYKNNVTVVPGTSYTVSVGTPSSFGGAVGNSPSPYYTGGSYSGDGGGNGGGGNGGGGGAGGYSGDGGNGRSSQAGLAGSGGGGGGGHRVSGSYGQAGGGGGVGILGQGTSGAGSTFPCESQSFGRGGSGGSNGGAPVYRDLGCCTIWYNGGSGGSYGGGAAGGTGGGNNGAAGTGAVRIIWPGCARSFPSTRTANE